MTDPMPGPVDRGVPAGSTIRLDRRTLVWSDGRLLVGGSPWRVSRVSDRVRAFVTALASTGPQVASTDAELAAARELIDRGFAHPLPRRSAGHRPCSVVVPARDRVDGLDRCLASLEGQDVTVVDDGSDDPAAVGDAAIRHGARIVRHPTNEGPAAARNTGLRHSSADLVAFLDSDCVAPRGWPTSMLHHFDDPAVAAVAPRVVAAGPSGSRLEDLLGRYEQTRSSLDMGRHAELVRPGARLGFVPTAALILRRAAIDGAGFDERLRLGEDVDLVWRLNDSGWLVRYDPSVIVRHESRTTPGPWLLRRFEYGTSAAALARRHPGRLAPARVSAWNLSALTLLATGRPRTAIAVTLTAAGLLARQLPAVPGAVPLAGRVVLQGLLADATAIGHLLRREWWPLGAIALARAPRSRVARAAAACMLVPIALEWASRRPGMDPARYTALRLLDDASYGTGVIWSAVRARSLAPLSPVVRVPDVMRGRGLGATRRARPRSRSAPVTQHAAWS